MSNRRHVIILSVFALLAISCLTYGLLWRHIWITVGSKDLLNTKPRQFIINEALTKQDIVWRPSTEDITIVVLGDSTYSGEPYGQFRSVNDLIETRKRYKNIDNYAKDIEAFESRLAKSNFWLGGSALLFLLGLIYIAFMRFGSKTAPPAQ